MLYAKSLNITAAFNAFKTALSRAPKMACLWYNIGILYEKCDQCDMAKKLYDKAIELDPEMSFARERREKLERNEHSTEADFTLPAINPSNETPFAEVN
jgi:predicted TPR repeat methyltransferase